MKKILMLIVIVIGTLCLTACGGNKTYDEISYEKLNTMLENKEDFILFIGAESCSACATYRVTINKVIEEYGIDVKYLDIDKLSDEEYSDLLANFYFTGTPTTIFVENGKEKDTNERIEGSQKFSRVVEKLQENGYIKEK